MVRGCWKDILLVLAVVYAAASPRLPICGNYYCCGLHESRRGRHSLSKTIMVPVSAWIWPFCLRRTTTAAVFLCSLRSNHMDHRKVEMAVEDLISVAADKTVGFSEDSTLPDPRVELRRHYNGLMYRAVLSCTKTSLHVIKMRACAKVDVCAFLSSSTQVPSVYCFGEFAKRRLQVKIVLQAER